MPPDLPGVSKMWRGRGVDSNPTGRFESWSSEPIDDGWEEQLPSPLRTELQVDSSRTLIGYNDSPDVPFDRSINPYRGCEHGCAYCFARPSHAFLGLSPGLDFESRLFYKPEAASQLRAELAHPAYRCAALAVGVNTDAYQQVERRVGITRQVVGLLAECAHPLSIITKSALVERDIDLLAGMADRGLASVAVSLTTLDRQLARALEPRAAAPARRLRAIAALSEAGIPVTVMIAPIIPVLTDHELESLLQAARDAGAVSAGMVLLRLPGEVSGLFRAWLAEHRPLMAEHVMQRVQDCRGGRDYDARFGQRMRGTGVFAGLLQRRFELATRRQGYRPEITLDCSQFRPPSADPRQLALF